jgi:hypothetical protein
VERVALNALVTMRLCPDACAFGDLPVRLSSEKTIHLLPTDLAAFVLFFQPAH